MDDSMSADKEVGQDPRPGATSLAVGPVGATGGGRDLTVVRHEVEAKLIQPR